MSSKGEEYVEGLVERVAELEQQLREAEARAKKLDGECAILSKSWEECNKALEAALAREKSLKCVDEGE